MASQTLGGLKIWHAAHGTVWTAFQDKKRRQNLALGQGLSSPVDLRNPQSAGDLNPSGTAEADADLIPLHNDRHLAVIRGELQHILQGLGVFFNIPINDRKSLFGLGLPGPQGERSSMFAEDGDLPGHSLPPSGAGLRNRPSRRENPPGSGIPVAFPRQCTAPLQTWD